MEPYKEKRKNSKLEIRTCINCGEQWYIRNPHNYPRTSNRVCNGRLLCDKCSKILSKEVKQHLYRMHSGNFHEEIRVCPCCGKERIVEVKNERESSGMKYFCKSCNSTLTALEKTRILREKIPGFHETEKQQRRDSYKRNIIHTMVCRAQKRALKYGYDFDLEDSDIIIPEKCPILEVPFVLGSKGNYEYTPTIDRVDNNKGYTKDNIQVISKKANSMKNSASLEELKIFCKNILRYSLNTTKKEGSEQENKESLG